MQRFLPKILVLIHFKLLNRPHLYLPKITSHILACRTVGDRTASHRRRAGFCDQKPTPGINGPTRRRSLFAASKGVPMTTLERIHSIPLLLQRVTYFLKLLNPLYMYYYPSCDVTLNMKRLNRLVKRRERIEKCL